MSGFDTPGAKADLRKRLDFPDDRLIAECEVHRHRTGGPGGQHRNKVSSAIRLFHKPSEITVIANESRLQGENSARALKRLREALALVARAPLPERIVWPPTVQFQQGKLRVSEDNPAVHHVIALVLDAFAQFGGRLSEAAAALGITSSNLTKFLRDHPKAWREACRMREEAGLPPLKA
jgi:hypothetical protein